MIIYYTVELYDNAHKRYREIWRGGKLEIADRMAHKSYFTNHGKTRINKVSIETLGHVNKSRWGFQTPNLRIKK